MAERSVERIVYSSEFERALRRTKSRNATLFGRLTKQIEKVIRAPQIGKPLRYTLKNRRRLHVGSFVVVYELYYGELRFLDFDHHDRIYKKY